MNSTENKIQNINNFELGPEWLQVLDFYEIDDEISEGSFGKVYKCKSKKTGLKVAIKHITNFVDNKYECLKVFREISILKNGSGNPFVPKLYDIIVPEDISDHVFIVTELMNCNLYDFILRSQDEEIC